MFVIPCKYTPENPYILRLVQDIRNFHDDEIVVVDSDSSDKSYFETLRNFPNVIIEDIANKNYCVGAYIYIYKKFQRDFYYFMHDTMRVKKSLDFLKEKDVTAIATFQRSIGHSYQHLVEKTQYKFNPNGLGLFGPILFCKYKVINKMVFMGLDNILPVNKSEAESMERIWGLALEYHGYDFSDSLFGDFAGQKFQRMLHSNGNESDDNVLEKFYAASRRP